VGWRQRKNDDLPSSTFDGSEATPSPYTDPSTNWVDLFTIVAGSLVDPSRLSNRLYQRRIGLVAGLFFLADAVGAYFLGLRWFALCLFLMGVGAIIAARWLTRIPLPAFFAVLAVLLLVVLPLSLYPNRSAATERLSCPWLSSSEVTGVLGPGALAGGAPNSAHCSWTVPPKPHVKQQATKQLSLSISYPMQSPTPVTGDTPISTVGLQAWTNSACDSSTCTETLSVVLSNSFLIITQTSIGTDQPVWQRSLAEETRHLIRLGSLVAARASPSN
jgi:hypothetical protein